MTRAHHEAVVAAKDETIALLRAQLERAATIPAPVPPVGTSVPTPPERSFPEFTFGKATELAILEQASGNKQLEAHLRAVAKGLQLQEIEDKEIARTIRRCETEPRTIAQVVVDAVTAPVERDVDDLEVAA